MQWDRRGFLEAVGAGMIASSCGTRVLATGAGHGALEPGEKPWRAEVPALHQEVGGHPLAYLDNAATTLRPRAVIDAIARFDETDNANPSASLHTLARRAAARLDGARERVARFLNASPEEIVFTRGSTEGINLVASTWGAARLRAGDELVLTSAEHASNLFPWQRVAAMSGARLTAVAVSADGSLPLDKLAAAITPRTRLVAVAHVSNVLGIVNPVDAVAAHARKAGAAVLVDAAQSAPHVRLDVKRLGCDFLVFSSHKMLGPMGVGVLWVRRDRFDEMPAYHVGSNMAHGGDVSTATPEAGAFRFQAGTPNVSGPVGLAAAIDLLEDMGFDAIAAHDRALAAHGLARLREVRGLRLLGTVGPQERVPVFSFTLSGVPAPAIVAAADAAGIAVREGDLAAVPLLRQFGIESAARASAYIYNTPSDIDRLVEVLHALSRSA